MIENRLYFSDANRNFLLQPEGEVGEVCIPNISPRERKKRVRFAIRYFALTLIALAALVALDANPLWRLPLFFMFSAAATSYIQALDKT
jgi:hypothetical protein